MRHNIKVLQLEQPETKIIGKQKYLLLNSWSSSFLVDNSQVVVCCRRGATWDGASIPRALWSLLGVYPGGRMLAPSLPHDGWCSTHRGLICTWFSATDVTPEVRDLIFRECLKHVGILKRRANLMWWAVTLYQKWQCRKYKIKYKG